MRAARAARSIVAGAAAALTPLIRPASGLAVPEEEEEEEDAVPFGSVPVLPLSTPPVLVDPVLLAPAGTAGPAGEVTNVWFSVSPHSVLHPPKATAASVFLVTHVQHADMASHVAGARSPAPSYTPLIAWATGRGVSALRR